ncbi:MAG: autotransporter-associated beta strand repeat-containing protein, partial [Candidatus Pacebacteria bacterium]|nr:autotransporter-associated beta strand repeat-containing protein [Candidatus Paceibacterota bacterium]
MSTITRDIATTLTTMASVCLLTVSVYAAEITWDAGGAPDTNWSTPTNWSDDLDPAGDDIAFDSTGLAASGTTNTVDQDHTVSSLKYQYIDSSNWHTTEIPESVTLTVDGVDGVLVGDQIDGKTAKTNVAVTGEGTLVVDNPSAKIRVFNRSTATTYPTGTGNATHMATLNLSDLNTFEAEVASLEVGVGEGSNTYARGSLYLAENNTVTADEIQVGRQSGYLNDAGHLYLGKNNTLNADMIGVGTTASGSGGGYGYVEFAPGPSNPQVTIRGKNGGETRADMEVGTIIISGTTSRAMIGDVDLTGGSVDALLGTLRIGYNQYAGANYHSTGTLSFDEGVVDATTIELGRKSAGPGRGTITVGADATLRADTMTLASIASQYYSQHDARGTINLNGGVLEAKTVQLGTSYSGHTQIATVNFNSGTIRNKADGNLAITDMTTFNLDDPGASHVFDAQEGYTISVNSAMSGDGGFTKTGLGTLDLTRDNTYTGNTTVSGGTLSL